jgi:hypothetical protein
MSYIQKDLPNQVRGDTWIFKFYIQTSAGAPENITGYDYWFTLKTSPDDTDQNAVIQVGPAVMGVIDAVAGLVTITVTPDITEDVIPGSYFYDLQEINASNKVSTLLLGKVKVVKDVTLASTYSGGVPDNWERETVGDVSKDLTGFVNTTDSDYSFNSTTRTFTLFPTGASFQLYYRGKLFTISSPKTIVIGNTPGGRYISFDPVTQNLVEGDNIPSLIDDLLVAYIYWNGTSAIIFGDERHSSARDTTWHQAQHLNFGAFWRNGGEISYTLNSNTVSLGFSNLTIADEDLVHSITHSLTPSDHYQQTIASNAVIPVLYLTGTNYTQTTPSSDPWVPAGVGLRAAYNQIIAGSGSLVEVGNGKFLTYWVLATNDSQYPIKLLMGSVEHATEKAALAETFVNYGLPFPEMVPLYKIVLQTQNSFVNAAKVHIISVSEIVSRQSTATTLTEVTTDSFVTSGNFNTSTGVLTLSGTGSAGATVNLNGRYPAITLGTTSPSSPSIGDLWFDPTENTIPSGGSTGQALIKNSNTNYDMVWGTPVLPIRVISTSQTILDSDSIIIVSSASPVTVTLPSASNKVFYVKNAGTGAITINTTGGQLIDGESSLILSFQWSAVILVSTQTEWLIL